MKTKLQLAIMAVSIGTVLHVCAQGYIVPNGVVDNLFPGEIDLNWSQQTQVNGFSLTPVGNNIFTFGEPVTIGVRVFLVSPNAPISLQPIMAQSYTELLGPNNYAFQAGVPFYVGLYSGANIAPPYPAYPPYTYLDPVFGWAQLVNNNGTIQLLGGALEYGGDGIYAGTLNIISVPEPGTFGLFALGGLLLGWRRWRAK